MRRFRILAGLLALFALACVSEDNAVVAPEADSFPIQGATPSPVCGSPEIRNERQSPCRDVRSYEEHRLDGDEMGLRPLRMVSDLATFESIVGNPTVVDFEGIPAPGTSCPWDDFDIPIPNPFEEAGLTITDPVCLRSAYCGSCRDGNIVLGMYPLTTLSFASHPSGVLLVIEGMGDNQIELLVTDSQQNWWTIRVQAISGQSEYLGIISPTHISTITYIEGLSPGEFVLGEVVFGHRMTSS